MDGIYVVEYEGYSDIGQYAAFKTKREAKKPFVRETLQDGARVLCGYSIMTLASHLIERRVK